MNRLADHKAGVRKTEHRLDPRAFQPFRTKSKENLQSIFEKLKSRKCDVHACRPYANKCSAVLRFLCHSAQQEFGTRVEDSITILICLFIQMFIKFANQMKTWE